MSNSKLNIELDRTEIKPDELVKAPLDEIYDGEGFERDPDQFEWVGKNKKLKKKEGIKLNLGNGLRLVERFLNKYAGWLVGNNENPIPSITVTKIHVVYWLIIVVLISLLWIK